jgi:putative transposase
MREVCTGVGAALREFDGETDHAHLPVHYPPSLALSMLATRLKGVSARRLRQQYPVHIQKYLWGKHFWSPSYFAAYCGGAPLTVTKQYIEHQNRPDYAPRYGGQRGRDWLPPADKRPGFRRRYFG